MQVSPFTPVQFSLTETNAPDQIASPGKSQVHLKVDAFKKDPI